MTKKTKTTKPFSIRLTETERADLERRAGKQALGDFIRGVLFAETPRRAPQTRRPRTTTADLRMLAQALALLGKAEIAKSLASLADAARMGALPVSEETETAIRRACRDVASIKTALMRGLGIKED